MRTYTQLINMYGTLTGRTTTAELVFGKQWINDGIRLMLGDHTWAFLEKTKTALTVSSQQAYDLPYDFDQLNSVTITVGSTRYNLDEAPTREYWDALNLQPYTSDIPQFFFIFGKTINFFPIPASNGNTITYIYKKAVKDIGIADYTTGTITTATTDSTSITGSGTSWTVPMAGSYLGITNSYTANTGDGFWYEISSIDSATTLTLDLPYGGRSISAGSAAYIIGQISVIPENYQLMPVYYAVAEYWGQQVQLDRAKAYMEKFEFGRQQMMEEFGSPSSRVDLTIQDLSNVNPNLYVRL